MNRISKGLPHQPIRTNQQYPLVKENLHLELRKTPESRPAEGHLQAANGTLYAWVNCQRNAIGSASLYVDRTPSSGYIDHIYVDQNSRRQGVASALISRLCEQLIKQGKTPRLLSR
ncbi:MAG: GNAT family N-acetyltransferase, partial [Chloroflexota bacterium]